MLELLEVLAPLVLAQIDIVATSVLAMHTLLERRPKQEPDGGVPC